MKRMFALLLCLAMALSVTACKPDNITYPVEIIDPSQQGAENASDPTGQDAPEGEKESTDDSTEEENSEEAKTDEETTEETEDTADDTQQSTEETEDAAEDAQQSTEETEDTADDAQQSTEDAADAEDANEPEEDATEVVADAEQPEEENMEDIPLGNPLAAEDFVPSTGVAGTLQASGIIKPGTSVSVLKNRTITLYTADQQPAFFYNDENGKPIDERGWMEKLAKENGFLLKYQIKSQAVSLKAQRVALFSGQKLSLVQMLAGELGNGMTLAASAADLLNKEVSTFGISKAVLEQSDYKLFAPVGNIETLWYDAAAMPEGTDPYALSREKKWTVEQFKAICTGAQGAQPLAMQNLLPWATLSGRSPLTLLDGKLDININAGVTREVWTELKKLDLAALMTAPDTPEGEQNTAPLFTYTATPDIAEGQTLHYAPLPAMKEGESGTATFTGTFFALPKYEQDTEALRAALTFAELWCNRYTEARAAVLQTLGLKGADYQAYCDLAETQGMLILYTPEIQKAAETYLSGLTDPAVDMTAAYEAARDTIDGLIAARNLYYTE